MNLLQSTWELRQRCPQQILVVVRVEVFTLQITPGLPLAAFGHQRETEQRSSKSPQPWLITSFSDTQLGNTELFPSSLYSSTT